MQAFLSLLMVLLVLGTEAAAQTVRDANASFIDVATRRAELRDAVSPRVKAALAALQPCPGQTPAPPTRSNGAAPHSYVAMEETVSAAATRYVATGDIGEARCVLDVLDSWATAGALLGYSRRDSLQTWFNVQWAATSAALSLSVVRSSPARDDARLLAMTEWLVQVAEHQLSQLPDEREVAARWIKDHNAYWRGLMAASIGVIARNGELFRLGLRTFSGAIAGLDARNTWPFAEGASLYEHNLGLQPLILIAELAARQDVDLYSVQVNGRSIHDAVRTVVEDSRARETFKPGAGDLAWAEFYVRRFPESPARELLTAPQFNRRLGGGATVYVAPAR
ncbi:MAG: alginate lyase family protein [Enhydrobacter sp.]|nr:MAG: alginate lyase family protein [Enhydrobacter sp.]